MDPRSFKDDIEYAYASKTAWAWAQAAEGILSFIEKVIDESESLSKKEKGENINKLREAIS